MLTLSKIKAIYCYLVFLIVVIWLGVSVTSLANNLIKLSYGDTLYTPSISLTKETFHSSERYKTMKYEEAEKIRQESIEEDKISEKKRLMERTFENISSLFFCIVIFLVHLSVIKRTKE